MVVRFLIAFGLMLFSCIPGVGQDRNRYAPVPFLSNRNNTEMLLTNVLLKAVQNDQVCNDLEILPYQREQIKELISQAIAERQQANERLSKPVSSINSLNTNQDVMADWQHSIEAGLSKVLLPSQVQELTQLARWAVVDKLGGLYSFLFTKQAKSRLEITRGQVDDLKEDYERLLNEYQNDIVKLRIRYRAKFIESLSESQQAKLNDLLGKPSSFLKPNVRF